MDRIVSALSAFVSRIESLANESTPEDQMIALEWLDHVERTVENAIDQSPIGVKPGLIQALTFTRLRLRSVRQEIESFRSPLPVGDVWELDGRRLQVNYKLLFANQLIDEVRELVAEIKTLLRPDKPKPSKPELVKAIEMKTDTNTWTEVFRAIHGRSGSDPQIKAFKKKVLRHAITIGKQVPERNAGRPPKNK